MKGTKKAFTIVELVIVIAVIAVLAAVLIPTFSNIIQDANVSADKSFASSFNTTLAVEMKGKPITSEAQLIEVYNKTAGGNAYADMAPKSAKQGYSYWFYVEDQRLVVAQWEGKNGLKAVVAENHGTKLVQDDDAAVPQDLAWHFVTPMSDGTSHNFSPLRTFTVTVENEETQNGQEYTGTFYLFDGTGEIVDLLDNVLDIGIGGEAGVKYKDIINGLEDVKGDSDDPVKQLATAVSNKLHTSVVVANGNTYVGKDVGDTADYIFANNVTTIGSTNAALPTPTGEDKTLVLPESVEKLYSDALNFSDATVKVEFASNEKVEGATIAANATNAEITVAGNENVTYTVEGEKLMKQEGENDPTQVGENLSVEYNKALVDSFDVISPADVTNNVNATKAPRTVYVNIDYTGEIAFKAENFKNEVGGTDVYSKDVTWTSSHPDLVTINPNTGKATLNKAACLTSDTDTVTITAIAKAKATGQDKGVATIILYIVKVNGYVVKMGENQLSVVNPFAGEYKIDTAKTYAIVVTPTYNIDSAGITPTFAIPVITASGTEFSYADGVLSMNVDENGKPIFSVKEGETAPTVKTTLTVKAEGFVDREYSISFTDKSECPLEVALPNTDKYLYFLGNKGAISLSKLFKEKTGFTLSGDVTVKAIDIINTSEEEETVDITTSGTGLDMTIDFIDTFTGPVEIVVTANGMTVSLYAKVVDATNVTDYKDLKDQSSVLLNDITMSANSAYYLSDGTLYGNGFTFDVTKGAVSGSGYATGNYLVALNNANIDNVEIRGAVYKTFGNTSTSVDYNRPVVLALDGVCQITNSFISNCASPLRVLKGQLLVENTTLKGGVYANVDIRGGNVTLRDVTTINQENANDKAEDGSIVIGLGVVFYHGNVSSETKLCIEGTFNQYNQISNKQASYIKDGNAKKAADIMFGELFADYQYKDGDTIWLNSGILSFSETVGQDNVVWDEESQYKYVVKEIEITEGLVSVKRDVSFWTVVPVTGMTPTPGWVPTKQTAVVPTCEFEYPTEAGKINYSAPNKPEPDKNDFCYYANGEISISMDKGDSFKFDPNILSVTKHGKQLEYRVTMNGTDYTDNQILFADAGDYTLVYSYTDVYHYESVGGEITLVEKTYTQLVEIAVAVVKPAAKNAEFVFGTTETTKVSAGSKTYISANVSQASDEWGKMTVEGVDVFYPIVEADTSYGLGSDGMGYQAFFPIFDGVVTITDYKDGGTGDEVIYDSNTTKDAYSASSFNVIKGIRSTDHTSAASSFNRDDSQLNIKGAGAVFNWTHSAEATLGTHNNVLCYISPDSLDRTTTGYTIAQFYYKDNVGAEYYYYVGYTMYAKKNDICVTPDTLVTLADGTQKEIQYVSSSDMILAWNFYTGNYEAVPLAFLFDHGYGEYNVLTLKFDDGTSINVINKHGFFDVEKNEFVFITEENVVDYVGHVFMKQDLTHVSLVDYSIETKETDCYSILTLKNYNAFLEGMFTLTPPEKGGNLFMPFEVGADMKFDEAKVAEDVATYGLYTYEEFSDLLTEEQFDALNIKYIKVAVEKGITTKEFLIYHIGLIKPVD